MAKRITQGLRRWLVKMEFYIEAKDEIDAHQISSLAAYSQRPITGFRRMGIKEINGYEPPK